MKGALAFLPGVVLGAATVAVMAATHTPLTAIALYAAAFLWMVTVPGVLVGRLLWESRSRFEELVVGSTVGLALQIAAWAAFTAVGVQRWLILWPLLVIIPMILFGRSHLHLKRYPTRLHPLTAWGLALACLQPLLSMGSSMARSHLPNQANSWYQDDYWHLALSAELMRSVPPELPQVAGTPFLYHWFANAHVATMALATGIDLPVVFSRLWMPAIVFLGLAMLVVAGRELTDKYWPGMVAALLAGNSAAIWTGWYTLFGTGGVFNMNSPSQQISVSFMLLALLPVIRLLRTGSLSKRGWLLMALAFLACAGGKASVLPVLVCGLALAVAIALVFNRAAMRGPVLALGLSIAVMLVGLPLTSGGSAGVKLQLFSSVRGTYPWERMLGEPAPIAPGLILPGLDRSGAPVLLLLLLVAYAVAYGWLLPSARVFSRKRLETWLLLGIGIAGWCAMMLLNQDGYSQVYFMSSAILGWMLLAGMGAKLAWDQSIERIGTTASLSTVILAAAGGWFVALFARKVAGGAPKPELINSTIIQGLAPFLGFVALTLLFYLLARRHGRTLIAATAWLALTSTLFGAALQNSVVNRIVVAVPGGGLTLQVLVLVALAGALWAVFARPARNAVLSVALFVLIVAIVGASYSLQKDVRLAAAKPAAADQSRTVTADETAAARWLAQHAGRDDIVATNVHCVSKKTVANCDARAFWVGAFSERRVLIEGWAYTAEAHRAHGVGGRRYANQPFHDQELFDLNEAAFADPTADVLDQLKAKGVRWLFADSAASPVSDALGNLAEEAHRQGTVTIYRID